MQYHQNIRNTGNKTGKSIYEEISDKPKNNFHNVTLRYKVKNCESNDPEAYLNKISIWVEKRVLTGWK